MTSPATLEDRDDAILRDIVEALVDADVAIAALEADKLFHLAAALRLAHRRSEHTPAAVQAREMEQRSIAAEIGVATRTHDRAVQNRMQHALTLLDDYPATVDALADGRISARHATVIREAGAVLHDADARAEYERTVLEVALSETPGRTQAFAVRLAEELRAESITERHEEAEKSRRVWIEDLGDGMSQLGVVASSPLVHGMWDRLTQQGRAVKAAALPGRADADATDDATDDEIVHDTRTLDQVRADLACDLMLTGRPAIDPTGDEMPGGLGAVRAQVSITVPALTAAGVHDRGASLDGVCPIDAETARALMAGSPTWSRVLTHPISGTVLAVDTYRRTEAMKRFLTARDVHCRFPGCRQPARRCDHDHNLDWARGGPTAVCNLACLCKRHHTLKTETPWRAHQRPDGSIRWTSPLGRHKIDTPERYVFFRPDPPATAPPPPPDDPPF